MEDCIFCKIIAGEAPADTVYAALVAGVVLPFAEARSPFAGSALPDARQCP